MENKIQLITYPDSLGGDLKNLNKVINKHFKDVIYGVHILPPFPSSSDRGFAPLTYFKIYEDFGDFEDIKEIGENHAIVLDIMINHISKESEYFQDFLNKGEKSKYADMFITLDKIWEDGIPVKSDVDKIFLRRSKPYSEFIIKETGERKLLWTTFGKNDPSEQIDIDINSPYTKELIDKIFKFFSENKVKMVRLDAVGYVIKKLGTSCFFVEPEIYDFLDDIKKTANLYNIELLPEIHSHYSIQYKLSEHGMYIYDFILPYVVLSTLIKKDNTLLVNYLKDRPEKQFTTLDCHDGIPVKPDLDDLIDSKEARDIVNICLERGASLSLIVSDEHKDKDGFDVHQIRCSYYSALSSNDDAYIAARAIQFFVPGIPQVYYVGLLAGENDEEAVKNTGEGREINRHNFTNEEIEECLKKDVVKRLFKIMKFRNEYDGFNGKFNNLKCENNKISMEWVKDNLKCTLDIDLKDYSTIINYIDEIGNNCSFKA